MTLYSLHNVSVAWRGPEVAFRDFNNNGTQDEANAAGDTFYHMPVLINQSAMLWARIRQPWQYRQEFGLAVTPNVNLEVPVDSIDFELTGQVIDHSLLYYLTDGVATTDNSPAVGDYTHVFALNSTTRDASPPTFELLIKEEHDTADIIKLYTGCIVTAYSLKGNADGTLIGTWSIRASSVIDGTDLTSWPEQPNQVMSYLQAIQSLEVATVAQTGVILDFEFRYESRKNLLRPGANDRPTQTLAPSQIDAEILITYQPDSDNEDDLDAPSVVVDLSIQVARDTTNDLFKMEFDSVILNQQGEAFNQDGILTQTLVAKWNPDKTACLLTLTEINDLEGTRYGN